MKKKPEKVSKPKVLATVAPDVRLLGDIRSLIEAGREQVAQAVNAGLVLLYWSVGERIRREILGNKRADYSQEIVVTLSRQLATDYGNGFSRSNLFRMIQFAELFASVEVVSQLARQLGWSHFLAILPMDDPMKRDFYAEMCRIERWSVRTLRARSGKRTGFPRCGWKACFFKVISTITTCKTQRRGRDSKLPKLVLLRIALMLLLRRNVCNHSALRHDRASNTLYSDLAQTGNFVPNLSPVSVRIQLAERVK